MARKKAGKQESPTSDRSNGAGDGRKNREQFLKWVAEVEQAGTMDEWRGRFAGTMSREKIAREGLRWTYYTPFHQNKKLKALADRVEKRWFGGRDKQTVESTNAALDRSRRNAQLAATESSRLASKVSELEAEVRTLRKVLRAYEEQRSLVASGVPGFALPMKNDMSCRD